MPTRLAVVIPAYRPSAGLVDLVRNLAGRQLPAIVVVDDGSGPEFAGTFAAVAGLPNVQLLRHAVNLGKGAALKTAFNHLLCTYPDLAGVVTADADGQHHPDDIVRVAETLQARPDALVLGARSFSESVPLRSRVGNIATRGIVHALLGKKLTDTQTGLRGIPTSLLPGLLRIESRGYEFELEMLIAAHRLSVPMLEIPIQTIYEQGNKSSHFNPVIDSMKIYFVLLRFGSVSLMTALIDNLVFILAQPRFRSVLAAQILGRAIALIFNYSTVRSTVFNTKQGHKTVLPKYLALVVLSGTCSYLGITELHKTFGMPVIPAKLLVETVLFFVNFAVQRLFIFKQQEPPASGPPKEKFRIHPFSIVLLVAFAALLTLEVSGIKSYKLLTQEIWSPTGWTRFLRFAEYYAVAAAILLTFAPRLFPTIMVATLALCTAKAVGPVPLLAVSFFLLSANTLGSRLLGRRKPAAPEHHVCATLLGTALYVLVMTLTARLPVNFAWAWGILLAAPILLDLRGVRDRLAALRRFLIPAEPPTPMARAGLAVLVFILVAHWFIVLKPENGADALAMHLAIPMNIAANHAMTFHPSRTVWAVMPMGVDFAYSIVFLFGGEYASRLLDFAMLIAIVALLYRAARRWVGPATAYLLAASFAATPIVQLVTGSLFVENVLAAMIVGLMTAIWLYGDSGERRYFFLAMLLGGVALSMKLGALAFVAIAVPFAFGAARRQWKGLGAYPALSCAAGLVLLLVAAAPPYAIAYARTGDPLFPFLTQKFHTPLLPAGTDLRDDRYRQRFTWHAPYDLVIHTNRYYEGQDGSAGFQYLVLVPLGLLGLIVVRPRPAVSAAVVAMGAGLVVMNTEPNVRYIYAALPLLLVPVASMLGWLASRRQGPVYGVLIVFLAAATGLNAYFLPSCSYYHKDFSLRIPLSREEHERAVGESAPLRKIIEFYSREHPNSAVLFTGDSSIAGATGDVYENHWHQITIWNRIHQAGDLASMRGLIESWKIRYFIGHKQSPGDLVDPPALVELLAACTVPEYEFDDYYLARYEPACNARTLTEPPLAVPVGYYDVYDPAVVFRGDWKPQQVPHGPDRDTIFTTDAPGAEVSMAFTGSTLYYMHGAGPDRGIAAVTIDGQAQDPVDQFWPEPDWQHRAKFCCLGPGKHVVVVRATGKKNPRSRSAKIDIDSFSVR